MDSINILSVSELSVNNKAFKANKELILILII